MRQLTLYSYFRSSAAYRVRIALGLKGVPFATEPVNLLKDGGQQRSAAYAAINPQMRVPSLRIDDEGVSHVLIQSPAILEWIEETFPEPPLLPHEPMERAHVRAIAAIVGCDIHPLNNSGTLTALSGRFGADEAARGSWYAKWIQDGFDAIEKLLGDGRFAGGEAPGMADVYLVPQFFNARRFSVDTSRYPKIEGIYANCAELPAFQAAAPDRQPDAV